MSSALSDEALLAGLAAGDADAATAFIRRFQARVYGLVVTIVRDEGVAEDVAQEFVRAWKHARTYDPRRGRVATWLLTIARNLAIDVIRVKSAQPLDPDQVEDRLQRARVAGSSPADQAVPPDERERVRGAIAQLPPEQRRALFLAAYLGRTAKEIGELEGVPLGTAKTRIRAAMLKLRDSLETAMTCDEIRELAPEIALGIADGEERAEALRHLSTCAECRRAVERLSGVADELLLMAPARSLPLASSPASSRQSGSTSRSRRRRPPWLSLRWLAPRLGPALAAAAVTAVVLVSVYSNDRQIADQYRDTLDRAGGQSFQAERLSDETGARAGVAFGYQGSPSWLFLTVNPEHRAT